MPPARSARTHTPWSTADLKARCRRIREQLSIAATDVVTAEELAAYWPGGAENPVDHPRGQWIYCFANYTRLSDRLRKGATDASVDEAEHALTDALADTPETVTLESGDTVAVQPLSYHALEFCAALDRIALRATEVAGLYQGQESEASETLMAFQPLVRSHAVQLWAWVLSAGPALPFDLSLDWPDPPAWTQRITPIDLLTLAAAHRRVNGRRNVLLSQLAPDDHTTTQRLSLGAFIGAYAHEHGGDAAQYMRRFALGKLFAQAISAARSIAASRKPAPAAPSLLDG